MMETHKKYKTCKCLSRREEHIQTHMRRVCWWYAGEMGTGCESGSPCDRLWRRPAVAVTLVEFAKGLV